MYGTAQQVGEELVCPDCGTRTVVRPPAAESPEKKGDAAHLQEAPAQPEEYAILEGVDQPAPDSLLVTQVYIPVICPVCHTRLLATPELVGQELVCPDCQTRCRVPPPSQRPTLDDTLPKPREGPDAEYGLVAGVDQPPPGSEAYAEHVAIECPVCHTRLHFTLDRVGQTAVCPDCQVPLIVPAPKPKLPASLESEQGPVDYAVDQVPQQTLTPGLDTSPEGRRKYLVPSGDRPSLPAHPFLTGVLSFPFYRGVLSRWLGLSLAGMAIAALGLYAAELAMQGYGALVAVFILAATGFLAAFWIAALGASFMVIVSETASGNDRIQEWPDVVFLDWMLDAAFLVNSLALAAVPGAALAWLDPGTGRIYLGLSILVGFPVIFLSMLERGSCVSPWSTAILRSLGTGCRGWAIFYLETTLGVAAAVGLTILISPTLGAATAWTIPFDLLILIIYGRLLGRLGWYLQVHMGLYDSEQAADQL